MKPQLIYDPGPRRETIFADWRSDKFERTMSGAFDAGLLVVFCPGCFDLLHPGHISMLEYAARLPAYNKAGVYVVAVVNSDQSVKRLKGDHRPVQSCWSRMYSLTGLRAVSCAVMFPESTPEALLAVYRPHVMVKGGEDQYLEKGVIGSEYVGRVEFAPVLAGHSTTYIMGLVK